MKFGILFFMLMFMLVLVSFDSQADFRGVLDQSIINLNVNPCADFYQYACGQWISKTGIPTDQSEWSRSFSKIEERNMNQLKEIIQEFGEKKTSSQISNFYTACMDEAKIEKNYFAELQKELAKIDEVGTTQSLAQGIASLHSKGAAVLFNLGSEADAKNANQIIASVDQGGIRLNRDYYLNNSEKNASIRRQYRAHISRTLELSGMNRALASRQAQRILDFETKLAQLALPLEKRRDPKKLYHLIQRSQLQTWIPKIDWDVLFYEVGAPPIDRLNVLVPAYFKLLGRLLKRTPQDLLKVYFRWQFLSSVSEDLGKEFATEKFNFFGKIMNGQKENKTRWKYCVDTSSEALRDLLGEAFVRKTFGEEGKNQARSLLVQIQAALANHLAALSWMDHKTRQAALAKLKALEMKIGYPDRWKDLSSLKISTSSHFENTLAAEKFWNAQEMKKVGKPVDRNEWDMAVTTVNAGYSADRNEIVFPAGILQPPFFSHQATLAENYGAVGMIMGHEITHGFDDEGRQYDAQGNLQDWWSPSVARTFEQKTQCLVNQFSSYLMIEKIRLNGKLTLGENIADLGGLKIAYAGFLAARVSQSNPQPPAFDPSGEEAKTFFTAFAQAWCSKRTPEIERLYALDDPHAAPQHRVNGVLANMPEFAQAFGCQVDDAMVSKQRCEVW